MHNLDHTVLTRQYKIFIPLKKTYLNNAKTKEKKMKKKKLWIAPTILEIVVKKEETKNKLKSFEWNEVMFSELMRFNWKSYRFDVSVFILIVCK